MEIPSQYNPKETEDKWYKFWEEKNLFSARNTLRCKECTKKELHPAKRSMDKGKMDSIGV